jgi:hypothetical protein
MKMADYTPGPWTIEEYGDDETPALVIHKDTESRVCFMATPGSHGDPAKIEADAHLIAAAPELLTACVAMLGYIESGFLIRNTKNDHQTDWALKALPFVKDLQAMDTAIRKATGKHHALT